MKELENQILVLGSWRVAVWDCNHGTQKIMFKIVTVEHKELTFKIITVEHKGLRLIFFLLVFLDLRKLILNCRINSGKRMVMTWQLMWLNLSVATLNTTLQLLVIYRFEFFRVSNYGIYFLWLHFLLLD